MCKIHDVKEKRFCFSEEISFLHCSTEKEIIFFYLSAKIGYKSANLLTSRRCKIVRITCYFKRCKISGLNENSDC